MKITSLSQTDCKNQPTYKANVHIVDGFLHADLKKSSSYGDKIIQRRAEQNQYIGDLYDECH